MARFNNVSQRLVANPKTLCRLRYALICGPQREADQLALVLYDGGEKVRRADQKLCVPLLAKFRKLGNLFAQSRDLLVSVLDRLQPGLGSLHRSEIA